MNNVRKLVVSRVCIVKLVVAYRRQNRGPRRVAARKIVNWSSWRALARRKTYLAALEKLMSVGRMVSVDETTHGRRTSAYRSAHIIQQPVHGLTANAYLERVLRHS